MTIRRAQTSDLDDLARLCAEHADFERIDLHELNQMTALRELIFGETPIIHCLVFESKHAVMGYTTFIKQVATWSASFYLYVDCMYIETAFRGRGLGKRVFQRLAQEAGRLGCDQLQWQTPALNRVAVNFYERLGASGLQKTRFTWEPCDVHPPAKPGLLSQRTRS